MFYKFIDLPNLSQIQTDVLDFVNSAEYALEENETHSIRFANTWQHIHSLVNAVETVCAWQHVNYIAFATSLPRIFAAGPHIDSESDDVEYPWALNIPIANWRQTYVNFYKLKKETTGTATMHGQDMYQYPCTSFNKQDIKLVETVCLDRPAFFNTREIHSAINFTATPRHIISVRFHIDLRNYNLGLA